MKAFGIAIGLVLLAPGAASAETPAKERVICKRVTDAETGSHFSSSRRICMTEQQWKEQEDETQRSLREAKSRTSVNPAVIAPGMGSSPQ